MDSIDYLSPSPFICPAIRWDRRLGHLFQEKKVGKTNYLIISNSYHISEDNKFSHSHQLRLLYGCNNKEGERNESVCWACYSDKIGTTYYFCYQCNYSYHKECVEYSPIFISPYHPKYPLQLLKLYYGTIRREACHSCGIEIAEGLFYYSSICDLFLDPVCARKREFPAINNPKRHEHTLHYLPRKASLPFDVCASDDNKYCSYICLQCDFVVHKTCIYLPRVIQIPHHSHRLSFTSSLPSGNWICGVCHGKIDGNYGEYSCTRGCTYAVHSKCATHHDVWDGKELEDQPEVVDENIEPFKEIGDGIIRHFSHAHHHMKFNEEIERVFDEKQHCQACILPFYDGNVYRCMQCDFGFHEACANLPRIIQNAVHTHRFILKTSDTRSTDGYFFCSSCGRGSCGFKYECVEGCYKFLDVRCASLSELADHQAHTHPLFVIYERGTYQKCSICGGFKRHSLNCVECDFVLCYCCATLPYKVKHEDDDHMLTLSYAKSASDPHWCQVCEETINPKKGYYMCNECGVTFHINCVLGTDLYMKTGQIIKIREHKVEIIPNNRLNRPICVKCKRRCQENIAFKTSHGKIYCSHDEVFMSFY